MMSITPRGPNLERNAVGDVAGALPFGCMLDLLTETLIFRLKFDECLAAAPAQPPQYSESEIMATREQ